MVTTVSHEKRVKQMPIRPDRLRQARMQAGYTQKELAKRIGIGESQIWRAENRKGDPSADHLARIARELNVSADYLLGLVEAPRSHLTTKDLSRDETELITALRRGDFKTALAYITQKVAEYLQAKGG